MFSLSLQDSNADFKLILHPEILDISDDETGNLQPLMSTDSLGSLPSRLRMCSLNDEPEDNSVKATSHVIDEDKGDHFSGKPEAEEVFVADSQAEIPAEECLEVKGSDDIVTPCKLVFLAEDGDDATAEVYQDIRAEFGVEPDDSANEKLEDQGSSIRPVELQGEATSVTLSAAKMDPKNDKYPLEPVEHHILDDYEKKLKERNPPVFAEQGKQRGRKKDDKKTKAKKAEKKKAAKSSKSKAAKKRAAERKAAKTRAAKRMAAKESAATNKGSVGSAVCHVEDEEVDYGASKAEDLYPPPASKNQRRSAKKVSNERSKTQAVSEIDLTGEPKTKKPKVMAEGGTGKSTANASKSRKTKRSPKDEKKSVPSNEHSAYDYENGYEEGGWWENYDDDYENGGWEDYDHDYENGFEDNGYENELPAKNSKTSRAKRPRKEEKAADPADEQPRQPDPPANGFKPPAHVKPNGVYSSAYRKAMASSLGVEEARRRGKEATEIFRVHGLVTSEMCGTFRETKTKSKKGES